MTMVTMETAETTEGGFRVRASPPPGTFKTPRHGGRKEG